MNVASPVNAPQRICVNCDQEPPADRSVTTCAACGGTLLELREPVDPMIGQVVDSRFEIRDRVGKGGMGTVYRAWQRSIGREVAVKLIDVHHSGDPMAVRRFMREARLASQLSQPNTVSVLDFGQANDGRLFIAMELVRGRTLAQVLQMDGPFPLARVVRVGTQLCDALDAAHRLEILHRDLKPPNIVVLDDPPGRDLIKVLDFGLAKSLRDEETRSTETGLVVGTPHYMAPEVIAGLKPSIASDLYSVGVILAELVTGTDVWNAESTGQLVVQKGKGLPPELQISGPLRPLLEGLLSPDPEQRPASAGEVREALLAMAEGNDPLTVTAGPPRASRPDRKLATGDLRPTTPGRAQPVPGTVIRKGGRSKLVVALSGLVVVVAAAGVGVRMMRARASSAALQADPGVSTQPWGTPTGDHASAAQSSPDAPKNGSSVPEPSAGTSGVGAAQEVSHVEGTNPVPSTAGDAASAHPPEPAQPTTDTAIVVHVESKPPGAAVRVDGVQAGQAPLDVRIAKGVRARFDLTLSGTTVHRTVDADHDQTLVVPIAVHHAAPATSHPTRHDALPF